MSIITIVINVPSKGTLTTKRLSAYALETHVTKSTGQTEIGTGASSGIGRGSHHEFL